MLTQPVKCSHCGSADLVRNGHSKKGKQRFQCRACKKYGRENPGGNAYDQNTKSLILAAYHERSSIRGLSRTFGVARNTVAACGVARNTVAACGVARNTVAACGVARNTVAACGVARNTVAAWLKKSQ